LDTLSCINYTKLNTSLQILYNPYNIWIIQNIVIAHTGELIR